MQIFGVQQPYIDATSELTKPSNKSNSSKDLISDPGMQAFQDYMKETPAQRMFDSFLAGQHISQSQYDAMSPRQQDALKQEFDKELKQGMLTTVE